MEPVVLVFLESQQCGSPLFNPYLDTSADMDVDATLQHHGHESNNVK